MLSTVCCCACVHAAASDVAGNPCCPVNPCPMAIGSIGSNHNQPSPQARSGAVGVTADRGKPSRFAVCAVSGHGSGNGITHFSKKSTSIQCSGCGCRVRPGGKPWTGFVTEATRLDKWTKSARLERAFIQRPFGGDVAPPQRPVIHTGFFYGAAIRRTP